MSEGETPRPRNHRWVWRLLLILGSLVAALVVGSWVYYRYMFPYGHSHACSKVLGLALRIYAGDHGDWLPYGKATPEASLGLLYQHKPSAVSFLGGKNVARAVVEKALVKEGTPGPDACGWHYVEGLREADDPQIAVVWDKVVGLGHHGERRRGLMHEVVLLDGSMQYISKARWPQFVTEQKEMLTKVIASRESNAPPIRWSDEATLGPNRFPAPVK